MRYINKLNWIELNLNVNVHYKTLLSCLWIKKKSHATVHDYTHAKHPHCVVTSVSLSPSKRQTCSWRQYTWFCLSICIRVENKPCVSKSVWELAYVCVTEILLSTIEFVCHWCESGSVHWVWFSMLTVCGLKAESGCNLKWMSLSALLPFSSVPFKKKRQKNVFPIPHVFSFFLLQQVFFSHFVFLSFTMSVIHSFLFFQLFSHLSSSPQSWLFSHSFLFSLTHFLLFL